MVKLKNGQTQKWSNSKMIKFKNDQTQKWSNSKMIKFKNDQIQKWSNSKMVKLCNTCELAHKQNQRSSREKLAVAKI